MKEIEIIDLFKKYLAQECTEEEVRLLMDCLQQEDNKKIVKKLIAEDLNDDKRIPSEFDKNAQLAIQKIDEYFVQNFFQKEVPKRKPNIILRFAVAATVLILSAISILIYFQKQDPSLVVSKVDQKSVLFTSDGKAINLDGISNVTLFEQHGATILQDSVGDIHVQLIDSSIYREDKPIFQTIRTAKGKQSRIFLADGSSVVLNSASELKFPLVYSKKQREVELQGEGFFDIETDKNKPFIVNTWDQRIKVYGTKFNVSSYADDPHSKTSLFQGKVSVQNLVGSIPQKEYVLVPGEQIIIDRSSKMLKQDKLDNEEEIVGWKNGFFVYENAPLKEVMKDFVRWYDLDVDLETLPDLTFSGTIPRNYQLDKALNVIVKTGNLRMIKTGSIIKFEN